MSLESLHAYDFDSDPEYQAGLSSILSQIPVELSDEERAATTLDAKCFYFSRKHDLNPPIDASTYNNYLYHLQSPPLTPSGPPIPTTPRNANSTTTTARPAPSSLPTPTPSSSSQPTTASSSTPSQPAYPPTFAELVDLITQNKPIPGIEEIPDTVIPDDSLLSYPDQQSTGVGSYRTTPGPSTNPSSSSSMGGVGRRKPWEKETQSIPTTEEQSNTHHEDEDEEKVEGESEDAEEVAIG